MVLMGVMPAHARCLVETASCRGSSSRSCRHVFLAPCRWVGILLQCPEVPWLLMFSAWIKLSARLSLSHAASAAAPMRARGALQWGRSPHLYRQQ